MMIKILIRLTFLFFWVLFCSFYPSEKGIQVPGKKLNKTIAKLWKDKELSLKELESDIAGLCFGNSQLFTVLENKDILGYIYIGRVNSCRSGGCSLDTGDAAAEFEYFDYFFVTDSQGKVLNVKVYNYRATHGHEIMSRGWLKQFIGYSGGEELIYGKDVEAISGATVSANAINNDIQMEVHCLKKWLSVSAELTIN
ncbi:MAG: FMN-binding protein [Bacteroidetes bacterium]|nr:MAG: FMN-binding protein [Bacteroidota bacterium]